MGHISRQMNPSPSPQTCFQPGLYPSVTEAGCFGQSWHHLCPTSSLQGSWAPFSGSSSISPPGTDLCGGGGHWASSCAPWSSGQPEGCPANGAEAQFSLGPILGREQGWSRVARLPWTPQGTQLVPPQLWISGGHSGGESFLLGMVGNFSSSTQARAGVGVKGGELFLHSMEKRVEGAQIREVGASGQKNTARARCEGPWV